MRIKFWGVRGSIATPGVNSRYGGNTACTELRLDDGSLIILDAGTGIRNLGNELMQHNEKIRAHILSLILIGITYKAFRFSNRHLSKATN